eukprot:CAMPEP_0194042346 /NCGR_PEP_ID=MMETSP0009_2-20130614/14131_1 /TAXON_ID=210454 /ORGANISM="Grammatophora oceanica, Strain CCMP 410" /LENGTH=366 /DNA_ID=CAMNT_0038686169 /DNA_START=128 /DNA_END=1228 /DNA_ORIENTATION=-
MMRDGGGGGVVGYRRRDIIYFSVLSALVATLGLYIVIDSLKFANSKNYKGGEQQQEVEDISNVTVPNNIWMFWDRGFDHESAHTGKDAFTSKETWELMNPTWTVHALDSNSADALTDRPNLIPDEVWQPIGMAGKADIYRILLLHKYGGVWADATVLCSVPLDTWLPRQQPDLFTFVKYVNLKEQSDTKGINPWFTSWFLVSPPGGYTLGRVVDIITDPSNFRLFRSEYFWFHRIIENLVKTDETVRRRLFMFPSADPTLCRAHDFWRTAPMFKRCTMGTFKDFIVPTHKICCGVGGVSRNVTSPSTYRHPSNNTTMITARAIQNANRTGSYDAVCEHWDCTVLGPNFDAKAGFPGLRNIMSGQTF